jgi:hypothetical protein
MSSPALTETHVKNLHASICMPARLMYDPGQSPSNRYFLLYDSETRKTAVAIAATSALCRRDAAGVRRRRHRVSAAPDRRESAARLWATSLRLRHGPAVQGGRLLLLAWRAASSAGAARACRLLFQKEADRVVLRQGVIHRAEADESAEQAEGQHGSLGDRHRGAEVPRRRIAVD